MAAASDTQTPAPQSAVPPSQRHTPAAWMRNNLFPNWWNSLLTLIVAPVLAWAGYQFFRFVFLTGRWEIVEVNLTNLMVGPFPRDQLWRLWVASAILALVAGLAVGVTGATAREAALAAGRDVAVPWHDRLRRMGPPATLLLVLVAFVRTPTPLVLLAAVVVLGAVSSRVGARVPPRLRGWVYLALGIGVIAAMGFVMAGVPQARWGGFLITIYFTIGSLLIAFPIGVALALGRRSTLPVVRWGCSAYIEFFRGAPLVALLFMGWLVLPFFLPAAFPTPSRITRALIIFILFTSAYVAEIVRGGLQSIPKGQWEAAQALGLSPWKQTRLIVLPQALRTVIPALVGQAISLYKDTPLVFIIGLLDLFSVATSITAQRGFVGQGLIVETLVFISLLYWVGSYWMSRESQRLEARMGVGQR